MKFPSLLKVRIGPKSLDEKSRPHSFLEHEEIENWNVESAVVSGLRSERLFFEPGETNSILEEEKSTETTSLCVEIDSLDPVLDFRASMEEMVEANGVKKLEELLTCYLEVNERRNHAYIVEAFADLLIHLSLNSASFDNSEKPASRPRARVCLCRKMKMVVRKMELAREFDKLTN